MRFALAIAMVLALGSWQALQAQQAGVHDLNTPRAFPKVQSAAEWEKRAAAIRQHALMSCGLWPRPAKTALHAKVFDRVDRDGYSLEKVYFETYPGFFLAGNLYRPRGRGPGPFPAVLNPHGHWANGRLADTELGSLAARCISFARQGMVAFTYDMAGYNDTKQVDHTFASEPAHLLWNISLMGLQTWNSVRALDFLESLPDVDRKKLACTGESGGGTQTFMLGAIDDRLAAQAPIVMVSHSMQGGCLCENAPGLRVDYSNMEFAAAAAPRPQILVGATGDWTKTTQTIEGPSIAQVYSLLGAGERFRHTIFDFAHNYNQTSREAVYAAFGDWLLGQQNGAALAEPPYKKEPDADLLVFPEGTLPPGALREPELIASLVQAQKRQLESLRPRDAASHLRWQELMKPAWEHALQIQHVRADEMPPSEAGLVQIRRSPGEKTVAARWLVPNGGGSKALVILAGGETAPGLAEKLRDAGCGVLTLLADPAPGSKPDPFSNYFSTYNRTALQNRVADLKALLEWAGPRRANYRLGIILVGQGHAGLACLAAAPLADAVAADCAGLDDATDEALLAPEVFFPGLRRLGGWQGIAALGAPRPLYLHRAGTLQLDWLQDLYHQLGRGKACARAEAPASSDDIASWIQGIAPQ